MIKKAIIVLFAPVSALALALFLLACGDTGTKGETTMTHVINLVHAWDAETERVDSYIEIYRNNEPFTFAAASVHNSIDTMVIVSNGDGTHQSSFPDHKLDTTRLLMTDIVTPIDEFQFRYTLTLPDTFSFDALGLTDYTVHSNQGTIQLEWTASDDAHGYFVVLKPANPANTAAGYSGFLTSGTTSESIPISAFNSTQGFEEGLYYVWVVAYHDRPIDYPGLPFVIPSGLNPNIDRVGVTGQAGAMYIPPKLELTAVSVQ